MPIRSGLSLEWWTRESCRKIFCIRRARHQDAGTVRQSEYGAWTRSRASPGLRRKPPRLSARSIRWFRRWHSPSAVTTSPSSERFRRSCGSTAWCRRMRTIRWRRRAKHILTCFVQYVPYHLREGNWDEKRELLGDRVVRKIARICAQCSRSNCGAAGAHSARPGANLRPDRGQHFSRRLAAGTTFLHAAGAGMVAVPDAG